VAAPTPALLLTTSKTCLPLTVRAPHPQQQALPEPPQHHR